MEGNIENGGGRRDKEREEHRDRGTEGSIREWERRM